jgi:hypothetical protein
MARPNDVEYKKLQWLNKKLSKAEEYCRPYFERAKRHYKLYRFGSAVSDADWPYVNRVRSKDIMAFVEDTAAMMVQTLFGSYPFYAVLPRETTQFERTFRGIDSTKIAAQLEKCLEYQIQHEDTEFLDEMIDYFKAGGIFGTSYVGVFPKFVNGEYARPLIRTVDFWDILPITNAKRISKTRGVFLREWMTMEEITEGAGKGKFKNGESIKELGSTATNKWHQEILSDCGIENYEVDPEEIEVIHYFTGGHVITMAARSVIIKDSSEGITNQLGQQQVVNPFPFDQPIVQYKYTPMPNEWFGMGIPEILEVLQEDKNLVRSARRDNIDLCINKILKAKANSDINFDLIKFYPGAIWPLENLNDIDTVEIGDVTQSAYMEEDKIRFDMENALSMFGYARGMTPTHEERPTTVIKLQQASMNRVDLAVKLAEFNSLQAIATRVILLTRRYMTQQTYEAIVGEPDAGFYRLSEEDIRKFYLVKPMGSSITHIKELRQQQMQYAGQLLMQAAPIGPFNPEPFMVNFLPYVKEALKVADIKNSDQIIMTQQNMMMGQQMMQAPPQPQELQQLQQIPYGGQPNGVQG